MKNISLKITDFQIEKISREAQRVVKGGDTTTPPEQPNPLNNGGGNVNG